MILLLLALLLLLLPLLQVGDCIGAEFEFVRGEGLVPRSQVEAHIRAVKAGKREGEERYTDDTAMARQIGLSLVAEGRLEARAVARAFTEEYFREPGRGYGGAVREVFTKLREQEYSEPLGPASQQFGGSGSYGNGAAMRAHAVGLAMAGVGEAWRVEEVAEQVARVTHSHPLGVQGGALQAVATYHAVKGAEVVELRASVEQLVEDWPEYSTKMGVIHRSLGRSTDDLEEVVLGHQEAVGLGNGVAAVDSVPTALYCYLEVLGKERQEQTARSQEAAQGLFEQVLSLAIQCGGDTDTIASMACALAGATLGEQGLPQELVARCEAAQEVRGLTESMCRLVVGEGGGPSQAKKVKPNE